jgi:hypothetical protein
LKRLAGCIDRGLEAVAPEQERVRGQVEEVCQIAATLDPERGTRAQRRRRFRRLQQRLAGSADPVRQQMAGVMVAFLVGLFAGGDVADLPQDNLELERWFRLPKGHERRIHGRRHAGVRLVQEGATLLPVLDAHRGRDQPFGVEELADYRQAQPPPDQQEALRRRKVMRRARSKKKRGQLLAELEQRYRDGS